MSEKQFPATLKPIVSRGYGQTRGGNIWRSQVQGGLPRQGRDVFYDAVPISVVLVVGALGRQAFWKFISSISGGADSFQMTHDSGNGLEPHNVLITSDISDTTQDGINWVISFTATAERTSVQEEDELTEALPPLYGEYGDGLIDFIDWYAMYCTTPNFIIDYYGTPEVQTDGVTAYFDGELYYNNNDSVAFSDLVAFSRLSGATYIDNDVALKTAAINEPRFEKDGLFIEGQSTNYATTTSTENGIPTQWTSTLNGCTRTITETTYGNQKKIKCRIEGTTTANYVTLGFGSFAGVVGGSTATASCIIKQTERTNITSQILKVRYNLTTGSTDIDTAIPTNFDGRLTGTHTIPDGANGTGTFLIIANCVTGSNIAFEVEVVCPQLEALPFATSYIPTNGAAATRAADSASVLMQPHAAGNIFAEFLSDSVAVERIVYTAGAITMKRLATGAISVTTGAVTVTSAVVATGSIKSAITYDGSTLKLAVNGVVYSAASALPSTGTSIALGESTFANVWQRSEAYNDAQLIEVTQ